MWLRKDKYITTLTKLLPKLWLWGKIHGHTCNASCVGDEDKTVERSSTLFRETSNASFICSTEKLWMGASWWACSNPNSLSCDCVSETERGGVKIGAKLSLSRPGNRMPLDFKLYNKACIIHHWNKKQFRLQHKEMQVQWDTKQAHYINITQLQTTTHSYYFHLYVLTRESQKINIKHFPTRDK